MCANTAVAKMRHVCAQIKSIYGKDNPVYDFAVAERKFYERYSGHIVGWGIITGEPKATYPGEKIGFADVNINEKYIPPVPYSKVKDLFKLNVYGSVTKLTSRQWKDIRNVVSESNQKQTVKEKIKPNRIEKSQSKEGIQKKVGSGEKVLKVSDKLEFSKKLDYLVPYFGVDSYMTAVYPEKSGSLPIMSKSGEKMGTYFIWSANESPNSSGCKNVINPDGTKIVE